MKKQFLTMFLLLQCMFTVGCGSDNLGKSMSDNSVSETSVTPSAIDIDEEPALQKSSEVSTDERQIVGNDTVGYVSVPNTWVKFMDVDGGTDFQYSDANGTAIITMNIIDDTGLSESQKAEMDLESVATSVWYNLEKSGVIEIEGAKVNLSTFEARQVYGFFKSEDAGLASCIVCWIFKDENGVLHYVSAEAPVESITEVVDSVEDSFTFSATE